MAHPLKKKQPRLTPTGRKKKKEFVYKHVQPDPVDSSSTIIGIDPGNNTSGGIACITANDVNRIDLDRIPMLDKKEWDYFSMIEVFRQIDPDLVIIEQQWARPMDPVNTIARLMKGYGGLLWSLYTLEIPVALVSPSAWKKELNIPKSKDKKVSIPIAQQLFPHVNLIPPRCRVPFHGWADALCILEYGRRYYTKIN